MLPVIETPVFELEMPSTGKKYKYRPFLVKEQKSLLVAQESGEKTAVRETLFSVIDACLFNKVESNTLSDFDIQYIFVKLRAKSIGESVDLNVLCDTCDTKNKYTLQLDNIKPVKTDGHTNRLFLTENIGVVMRYPTFEEVQYLKENYTTETIHETISKCIDIVFDHDNVTMAKDVQPNEIMNWLDNLNQNHYKLFETFFKTQPTIKTNIDFVCSNCGTSNHIEVEGIDDFFD